MQFASINGSARGTNYNIFFIQFKVVIQNLHLID